MRRLLCAVIGGVVLGLPACSSDPAPAAGLTTDPVGASPATSSGGGEPAPPQDTVAAAAPALPEWTPADAEATRVLALAALRAFAHPELVGAQWEAGLAPYLTDAAATAFAGTDPSTVPLVGEGAVHEASVTSPSAFLAEAVVATDAGPYRVLMVRVAAEAPWQVERLEPAA